MRSHIRAPQRLDLSYRPDEKKPTEDTTYDIIISNMGKPEEGSFSCYCDSQPKREKVKATVTMCKELDIVDSKEKILYTFNFNTIEAEIEEDRDVLDHFM